RLGEFDADDFSAQHGIEGTDLEVLGRRVEVGDRVHTKAPLERHGMFRTLASWLMRGSVVDLVVRGGLHVIDIRECLKVTDSYMHMRAEPEEGSVAGSAGGDAGAPGAGAAVQVVFVEAGQAAVVEQLLAADPEVPGAGAAAG